MENSLIKIYNSIITNYEYYLIGLYIPKISMRISQENVFNTDEPTIYLQA